MRLIAAIQQRVSYARGMIVSMWRSMRCLEWIDAGLGLGAGERRAQAG